MNFLNHISFFSSSISIWFFFFFPFLFRAAIPHLFIRIMFDFKFLYILHLLCWVISLWTAFSLGCGLCFPVSSMSDSFLFCARHWEWYVAESLILLSPKSVIFILAVTSVDWTQTPNPVSPAGGSTRNLCSVLSTFQLHFLLGSLVPKSGVLQEFGQFICRFLGSSSGPLLWDFHHGLVVVLATVNSVSWCCKQCFSASARTPALPQVECLGVA